MPLPNDLLNPISPESPAGQNLRYDPIYDKIREARREDDDVPQGEWKRDRKMADWPLTIKLITEALSTKTKDLQLVAWLAEAMIKREGIAGLRQVINLAIGMIEIFWDGLYPEIEDGDLEIRVAPLQWMGDKLEVPVKLSPVTKGGLNALQCREARTVLTEEAAAESSANREARAQALKEGKIPPEQLDKDFADTPKAFFFNLEKTFDGTMESLQQLSQLCDEKFGDVAPSFRALQDALQDVRQTVHSYLQQKRETDPDPEPAAGEAGTAAGTEAVSGAGGAAAAPALAPRVFAGEPKSWVEAAAQVVATAKGMRKQDPYSPAPFLLLRALRWGELRSDGARLDPKKLAAPPTDVRQNLKRLALEGSWKEALEAAETAMGMECGRGWLDIQRYVVWACDELGGYYQPVRRAVIAELRALLEDYPQLPELILMDDMPAASPDTIAWIRKQVVVEPSENGTAPTDSIPSTLPLRFFEMAMQAAKAGMVQPGVELLMREISREPSGRGRFLRRIQVAQQCSENGADGIAISILREAAAEIEQKKLEEWEPRELLAYPLALFYRCLVKTEDSMEDREKLYSWICRLDPVEAMKLTK